MRFNPKVKLTKAQIKRRFRQIAREKEIREEVGKMLVEDIQSRNYRSVDKNEPYGKYRDRIQGKSGKHKPRKINMTITGELLQDIINNVKTSFKNGKIAYIFEHSNKKHKPYRVRVDYTTKKGEKKSKIKTQTRKVDYSDLETRGLKKKTVRTSYKVIQKGQESNGYDYLSLTDKMRLKIVKKVSKLIIKTLRKTPKKVKKK